MIRDDSKYRPAAAIVLFNLDGHVFLGKRRKASGPYVWQFPQGGIDKGEKPRRAALRELEEETGIDPSLVVPLGRIKDWLYYDFPEGFTGAKRMRGWHGQRQKYYAYKFIGTDQDINLNAYKPPEFTNWRWEKLALAPKLVVPFKRPVYDIVAKEFAKYAKPSG